MNKRTLEFRDLLSEDLQARLAETKEELFNLRFQSATGQLENYGRLGLMRRDIARIMTLLNERELGISFEPTPEQAEEGRRRREAEEAAREEEEKARKPRRRRRRRGEDGDEAGAEESAEAGEDEDDEEDDDDDAGDDE